jgi:Ca-activated chloride channel family protein
MKKMILVLAIALLGGCSTPTKLIVNSHPSSAKVFINGNPIGETPVEHKLEIEEQSSYLVKVEKDKYLAMTKTVVYDESREVITLNFDMEPKRHEELIVIETEPAGAAVVLDDEFLCETPCELELDDKDPNIRRTLKIEKIGYDPRLLRVKYKGDNWKEDNFADKYVVYLRPERTLEEIKMETGHTSPPLPANAPTVIAPTIHQGPTIAPIVPPYHGNNNYTPSGPVISSGPEPDYIPSGPVIHNVIPSDPVIQIHSPSTPTDRENYAHFDDNSVKRVSEHPVSTFSIDVDTGSYSNVRRMLNYGQLPSHDAVRVEEMINYFAYDYPLPDSLEPPFKVTTEIAPTPWNQKTHLLHVGIKGYNIPKDKLPPANLVFLVDVSGSMQSHDKLELLKSSLKLLSKQLTAKDKVSLVVYAGASGLVLEPTPGNQSGKIIAALARLSAGGSTNGGAGIQLAYAVAKQAFIRGGINRVLLATDGDFNVGTVDFEALKNIIEEKRKSGISLTTLGFGTGNYDDHLMEQLADAGNGNYAYIDNLNEAQKVLVDEMSSTINTIAKDVKIQIEFNPVTVAEYRLIGYENRMLKREDFSNDKVDAGEIGAGHTVTALYEIALVGSGSERLENLRYGDQKTTPDGQSNNELVFLRLRYKAPDGEISKLLEWPIMRQEIIETVDNTSTRFRFSAAVAAFGQQLRGGKYLERFSYDEILNLARGARGDDLFNYRAEFIKLVNLAHSLGSN